MKLRRIISIVLAIMMVATIIPFATISSSAAAANKYETAAHEIDSKYRYDQTDLGATYTPEKTTFKVWAPTATKCVLNLYTKGSTRLYVRQCISTINSYSNCKCCTRTVDLWTDNRYRSTSEYNFIDNINNQFGTDIICKVECKKIKLLKIYIV